MDAQTKTVMAEVAEAKRREEAKRSTIIIN